MGGNFFVMQQGDDNVLNAIPVRGTNFPNWADLLLLLVIFFIGAAAATLITPLFIDLKEITQGATTVEIASAKGLYLFISYTFQMILALGITLAYSKVRGYRGRMVRFSAKGLNPLLNLWALLMLLAMNLLLAPLFKIMDFSQIEAFDPGRGIWALLSTVVMAPVLEEVMCRGVILEPLRSRYGAVVAWLVSSLFFGLIHIHPVMVINAIFIGMLLAYLYLRSESLWPCIILHMFNNGVSLLMLWTTVPDENGSQSLSELDFLDMMPPALYIALYVCALVFVLISGVLMWYNLWQWHSADRKKRLEEK